MIDLAPGQEGLAHVVLVRVRHHDRTRGPALRRNDRRRCGGQAKPGRSFNEEPSSGLLAPALAKAKSVAVGTALCPVGLGPWSRHGSTVHRLGGTSASVTLYQTIHFIASPRFGHGAGYSLASTPNNSSRYMVMAADSQIGVPRRTP